MADMDLPAERREYQHGTLTREELLDDPIAQFELWLVAAKEFGLRDPTAVNLATVDAEGMPYQRIVLLKGLSPDGFVFFTNTESRKAQHIAGNAQVCLHFAWLAMDRQVIINGRAEALPKMDVVRYFAGRPRESQLAAWASRQSFPVTARRLLEEKFHEMKRKFADGEVPLPGFWGGYRVRPRQIEFWQGGVHRLHDRFLYQQRDKGWEVTRLSP